ncbi:MAG TPA: LPS assembly protein LptD [Phycisphaerae bacterium]|nr:LPS assembly protein LptD [Phycisphaerae bacterium]HOJ73842.1 LPS assembly protein LptD [Phycisphaerae bacterium]HOM50783.1 LPS assembly protein LptD [Phycisphaerae bacterium]HON65159.1 LPS assembly protein LptD [Phycisphaerae bacterium]HOQ85816.1 LPS assembly protein LptD [Phycisphaerae bacterium]
MYTVDRFFLGLLCVAAFITAPARSQVAPLVPLGEPEPEEPLLPAGITRTKPEAYGQYAHVWSLEDGTHVIQYYGDFSLHLGARRLTSRDAVIWMQRTAWKDLEYFHYDVFLSTEANVRDAAGTVTSGPTLFVTFNSFEPPELEMDSSTSEPSTRSTLYEEASRVRQQVLAGRPADAGPDPLQVVNPDAETREPRPEPRPIVRYRSEGDIIIDERAGTITIPSKVYLSQGLIETGEFSEMRADAAVIFLSRRPEAEEKAEPEDVLAPEEPQRTPGTSGPGGAFGTLGGEGQPPVAGVYLRGDVVLTRGEQMVRASELYYDLENDRALILDAVVRVTVPGQDIPLYVRAEQVRQLSSTEFMARKARVSTSEFSTPHVHLGAEKIYLTDATPRGEAGEVIGLEAGRYRAENVTLNLEGVPLAYWPYATGDFRREEVALRSARVAYSDDFGMSVQSRWFLFNLLGVERPKGIEALLITDYFSKRGPAVGMDVDYEDENSFGLFRGYYIHDHGTDDLGAYRDGSFPNENRGRITWRHREYLSEDKSWQLTLEGSYLSDANFLEEYFYREFEEGKEQETLAYLKKQQDNWAFTLLAQWRIVDFLTQTEHLPDAAFRWIGQPLGEIANYYSESHAGLVRRRVDDRRFFEDNRWTTNDVDTHVTVRTTTRNEVDFPITLGNAQVVPFAMANTGYWDASARKGATGRAFGMLGVRSGTQFWRVFENVASRLLDVYGLRHVIKPEVVAWLSASNIDSLDLYQFDRGIEDIDDFYGTSLALRQRWQTKRGGPGNWRIVDWIKLDVELNLFGNSPKYTDPIGRFYDYRPENSNARNHVRTDFSFRLSDTATLLADSNWDLNDGKLDLFNVSYAVEYTPRFSYVLGYRRIADTDSNLIGLGTNYEFNSKYRMAFRGYYDIERSKMETFDVTIVRRWPRWFTAVTFGLDNIEEDIHISFSIWPEGAPRLALGSRKYTSLAQTTAIRAADED